jgi:LPXTG-motif cell wall-anchored protein
MMAYLVGIFIAKLLSIAGIGGLLVGLFVKRWPIAVAVGLMLGIVDTLLLASTRYTGVTGDNWIMAIIVAMLTASLGWWLRRRQRV